jgi:hypothetical protein
MCSAAPTFACVAADVEVEVMLGRFVGLDRMPSAGAGLLRRRPPRRTAFARRGDCSRERNHPGPIWFSAELS